jgi:hypothetical protein
MLAWFAGYCQERLELGLVGFFVYYAGFDVGEVGLVEEGFQLRFAEAEPLVGVHLSGFFEAVFGQVEDDDAAAGGEDAGGFMEGAGGVQGVVEGLGEEDQIDFSGGDGELFHIAEAEIDIGDVVAAGLFAADFDHFGGGVDGDDVHGSLGEQESKAPFAGAEIGDAEGWEQAEEGFGEALPGFAGDVIAAETAGDGVKEGAHLVLALAEDAAAGVLVGEGFRDLAGGAGE